ncbi:MAG: hypothetical protein EBS78_07350 [Altererythrobacter sp.]|nr:hypothetical protein [Altererythrobacter sp.]
MWHNPYASIDAAAMAWRAIPRDCLRFPCMRCSHASYLDHRKLIHSRKAILASAAISILAVFILLDMDRPSTYGCAFHFAAQRS